MAKREQWGEQTMNVGSTYFTDLKTKEYTPNAQAKYKRYICGRAKNRSWVPLENSSFGTPLNKVNFHMLFQVSLSAPLSPLKREKIIPWISFVCFLWALEKLSPILRMCQMWRASLNIRTFQALRAGPVQVKGILLPLSRSWKQI